MRKKEVLKLINWCKTEGKNFEESYKFINETFGYIKEYDFILLWEGRKIESKYDFKKIGIISVIPVLITVLLIIMNIKPEIYGSSYNYNTGSYFQYPVQKKTDITSFTQVFEGQEAEVTPRAEYVVGCKIVSLRRYGDTSGKIAPVDIAGVWGGLMDEELLSNVSISQSDRFYYFRYSEEFPFDASFIYTHSSNMHLVPATDNLRNVLMKLTKNDEVVIEGYLVNLKWKTVYGEFRWNTSMSRSDSGAGACEVIYVKKMILDGILYE